MWFIFMLILELFGKPLIHECLFDATIEVSILFDIYFQIPLNRYAFEYSHDTLDQRTKFLLLS